MTLHLNLRLKGTRAAPPKLVDPTAVCRLISPVLAILALRYDAQIRTAVIERIVISVINLRYPAWWQIENGAMHADPSLSLFASRSYVSDGVVAFDVWMPLRAPLGLAELLVVAPVDARHLPV